MEKSRGRKFSYLDGVRGLAALIVVLHHYAFGFFQAAVDGNMERAHSAFEKTVFSTNLYIFIAGNFAVCVFFILSGIVLSAKFFSTDSIKDIQLGAVKRYLRLMIPIFGAVMVAFVLVAGYGMRNTSAAIATNSAWLGAFWQFYPTFTHAIKGALFGIFLTGKSNLDPVLWTMHYELYGSFLVFMIIALFGRMRLRWAFYLGAAMAFYNTYYLSFVLGVVLCDLYHSVNFKRVVHVRGKVQSQLMRFSLFIAGAIGLVCAIWLGAMPNDGIVAPKYLALNYLSLPDDQLRVLLHTIGALLFLIVIMLSTQLKAFFNTKVLQWLGKISFSMYLLHILVIGSLSSALFVDLRYSFGYFTSFVIMLVISLVVLFIASSIFTRFVDSRAVSWSNRFGYFVMDPNLQANTIFWFQSTMDKFRMLQVKSKIKHLRTKVIIYSKRSIY